VAFQNSNAEDISERTWVLEDRSDKVNFSYR